MTEKGGRTKKERQHFCIVIEVSTFPIHLEVDDTDRTSFTGRDGAVSKVVMELWLFLWGCNTHKKCFEFYKGAAAPFISGIVIGNCYEWFVNISSLKL